MLVGNSIGSLATLMAADAAPQAVAGLVLLNCAGGMNNKVSAGRCPVLHSTPRSGQHAALLACNWRSLSCQCPLTLCHLPLEPPFLCQHPPATPHPPPRQAIADDWRIRLALPIFWLIDFLLQRRNIAEGLFNRFCSPENIRTVLKVLGGAAGQPGWEERQCSWAAKWLLQRGGPCRRAGPCAVKPGLACRPTPARAPLFCCTAERVLQ